MRFIVPVEFTVEADDKDEAKQLLEEFLADSGVDEAVESWNAKRDEGVDILGHFVDNKGEAQYQKFNAHTVEDGERMAEAYAEVHDLLIIKTEEA